MKKLRITVDGKVYDVDVEILQDDDNQILPSYYQQAPTGFGVNPVQQRTSSVPVAAPKRNPNKVQNSDSNVITSPINGVVIEIRVKVGDVVKEDDTVIVLEAMKMKTNISSPTAGEIASIEVQQGDTIESGDVLVTFKQG